MLRTRTSLRSARVRPPPRQRYVAPLRTLAILATIIGRSWVSLRCRTTASHVVRPLHSCRVQIAHGRFAMREARVTPPPPSFPPRTGCGFVAFAELLTHGRSVARTSPRSVAANVSAHYTPRTIPVRRRACTHGFVASVGIACVPRLTASAPPPMRLALPHALAKRYPPHHSVGGRVRGALRAPSGSHQKIGSASFCRATTAAYWLAPRGGAIAASRLCGGVPPPHGSLMREIVANG